MILDRLLQVSTAQALTATAASTDNINLSSAGRIIAPGEDLYWIILFKVALAGASPTFAPSVESYTDNTFGTPVTQITGKIYTTAPAGSKIVIPMPWENQQFLRLKYTLGGTSPTATIDAYLASGDPSAWIAYPDAI